ncbi:MAG: hypothetical protein ACKER6_00865 [Candidatus Hodgkinia cicadicola]
MLRCVCVDGGRTVGLSKSMANTVPRGHQTRKSLLDRFVQLHHGSPTVWIITLPLGPTGKQNEAVRRAQTFAALLRTKRQAPVLLRDERWTSRWGSSHSHSATLALQAMVGPRSLIDDVNERPHHHR